MGVSERRERWAFLGEIWLTIVVSIALFPVLLDLWAGRFTELAARMEHGLALAVVWPVEQLREVGFLARSGEPLSLGVPLAACATAALLITLGAALIDPKPGTPPRRWRRLLGVAPVVVCGTPALVGALALCYLGAALAPSLWSALVAIGVAGGLLGRRRRREPVPHERSLSGLPPANWKTDHLVRFGIVFGALTSAVLAAAVGALPWDEAPLRLGLALDAGTGITGPLALPWAFGAAVVLVLLLTPYTRRAMALMTWEPWTASAIGGVGLGIGVTVLSGPAEGQAALPVGFALGLMGALLAGAGVPVLPRLSVHPVRAVGRLWLPIAAALAVFLHTTATGFLGCERVAADPRIQLITHQPGAIDVVWADGPTPGVIAAFRAEAHLVRLGLAGESTFVVEGSQLPLRALDTPGAEVRPVGLGTGHRGRVFLVAEVLRPGTHPATALVELDPADAGLRAVAEDLDPCRPATFGWNPILHVGVVGCRDVGEVLLYEPSLQQFIAREPLRGAEEFQSLVIDPGDGSMISLAQRASPFVVRLDLTTRRPIAWQFLGLGNRTLHLDELGVLRVARFLGRQVLTLDAELKPVRATAAGFALGPLEEAPWHDSAVTASVLDGHLYAIDTVGRSPTRRLRVGGLVQSLSLDPTQRTLYAAGLCGVMAIDLDRWLD